MHKSLFINNLSFNFHSALCTCTTIYILFPEQKFQQIFAPYFRYRRPWPLFILPGAPNTLHRNGRYGLLKKPL